MVHNRIFIVITYFFLANVYAVNNNQATAVSEQLPVDDEVILTSQKQLQASGTKVINHDNMINASAPAQNQPLLSNQTKAQVNMNNLNEIDSSSGNLLSLKRRLEIEKAEAELKKIRNNGSNNPGSNMPELAADNIQTTVTGVAINQEGKKIAWLQFADGGSLTVNIGSKLGTYMVSDITMNGVKLSPIKGKGRGMFLKRAYYAPEKAKQGNGNSAGLGFTPSPIVTSANNGNEMVPPIVPIR